ncbi:hypothetical protein AB0M43_16755 [Longispora sp. NPDC051575]|uniref:hypothetical protein n=1 Tax=Longispora sp. NPDC051575 TaxID=3154943 RepID=UPI003419FC35
MLSVRECVTVAGRVADTLTGRSGLSVIVVGVVLPHWPEPSEQATAILGAPVDNGPVPVRVTFECEGVVIELHVDPRLPPGELADHLADEIADYVATTTRWWGKRVFAVPST